MAIILEKHFWCFHIICGFSYLCLRDVQAVYGMGWVSIAIVCYENISGLGSWEEKTEVRIV